MRNKPVCISCANEKRILPNQPSIALGNINEETVLLADAVRLGPCSCVFCKDCFLQYVISTRLEPELHCPDCGNLIESHRTTITKECHASAKHDTKYALTSPREILGVVQHNWGDEAKSNKTQANEDESEKDVEENDFDESDDGDDNDSDDELASKETDDEEDDQEISVCAVTTPKARKKSRSKLATSRTTRSTDRTSPRAKSNIQLQPPSAEAQTPEKLTENNAEDTSATTTAASAAKISSAAKKRKASTPKPIGIEPPRKKRGRRKTFDEQLSSLQAYKHLHGHCWVFKTKKQMNLYNWVDAVRNGRLEINEDEKEKLNEIGFIWDHEKPESILDHTNADEKLIFEEKYKLLLSYKQKHGHCWVYPRHGDVPLYLWVLSIRNGYRPVDAEEEAKLDDIGFIWDLKKPESIPDHPAANGAMSFEDHYKTLVIYKENYGHCWVYSRYADPFFYRWVNDVRNGRQPINDEERAKLDQIGFIWDLKKPADIPGESIRKIRKFEEYFEALLEFKQKYGHCWVYNKHDKILANWVKEVRKGNREISDEEKEKLTQAGFIWDNEKPEGIPDDPNKKRKLLFEENFEKLKAYHAEHGDCLVPNRGQKDKVFKRWVYELRTGKRYVTVEEKAKLDALNFPWEFENEEEVDPEKLEKYRKLFPRKITFEERFADLLEYKKEHGDCNVRQSYSAKRNLGDWVSSVRIGTTGTNREERKRLTAIGFPWESKKNKLDREWNEKLEQLRTYKAQHGDCRPKDNGAYKQLCEWCRTQRKLYNKNKLREDRQALLDELDFPWSNAKPQKRTDLGHGAYESYQGGNESFASRDDEYGNMYR